MTTHVQYHVKDRVIHIEQVEETKREFLPFINPRKNVPLVREFV